MVKHITGWSAFFSYYRYGCYCGLGSKGIPVDDTDRCCRAHDCCYEKPKESGRQPVLNGYSSTPSMAPWFEEELLMTGIWAAAKEMERRGQSTGCFKHRDDEQDLLADGM
ncbi:group IIC secretory phospholipase A2 isoform X1 [Callithrix jacchus]